MPDGLADLGARAAVDKTLGAICRGPTDRSCRCSVGPLLPGIGSAREEAVER